MEKLNGRRLHLWRGRDVKQDTAALCDALAATTELFNDNGTLVRLDQGKLVPVNLAALRDFIAKHIAGVRLVNRGGTWQREFFTYAFAPRPRPPAPTWENPHPEVDNS